MIGCWTHFILSSYLLAAEKKLITPGENVPGFHITSSGPASRLSSKSDCIVHAKALTNTKTYAVPSHRRRASWPHGCVMAQDRVYWSDSVDAVGQCSMQLKCIEPAPKCDGRKIPYTEAGIDGAYLRCVQLSDYDKKVGDSAPQGQWYSAAYGSACGKYSMYPLPAAQSTESAPGSPTEAGVNPYRPKDVLNFGKTCWERDDKKTCGRTSASCSFCGSGGMCCLKGQILPPGCMGAGESNLNYTCTSANRKDGGTGYPASPSLVTSCVYGNKQSTWKSDKNVEHVAAPEDDPMPRGGAAISNKWCGVSDHDSV